MKVYLLVKESYIYWDNDYSVTVKTFSDRQSAINYLTVEKEILLEDAMKELNVKTKEELQRLADEEDGVWSYTNEEDSYFIDIEEWGHDSLDIIEQDVMEFNI